jgi:hypothetical protein
MEKDYIYEYDYFVAQNIKKEFQKADADETVEDIMDYFNPIIYSSNEKYANFVFESSPNFERAWRNTVCMLKIEETFNKENVLKMCLWNSANDYVSDCNSVNEVLTKAENDVKDYVLGHTALTSNPDNKNQFYFFGNGTAYLKDKKLLNELFDERKYEIKLSPYLEDSKDFLKEVYNDFLNHESPVAKFIIPMEQELGIQFKHPQYAGDNCEHIILTVEQGKGLSGLEAIEKFDDINNILSKKSVPMSFQYFNNETGVRVIETPDKVIYNRPNEKENIKLVDLDKINRKTKKPVEIITGNLVKPESVQIFDKSKLTQKSTDKSKESKANVL